jgi:dipeptidyl aminopeptidase/acylaminoacyl peptidase
MGIANVILSFQGLLMNAMDSVEPHRNTRPRRLPVYLAIYCGIVSMQLCDFAFGQDRDAAHSRAAAVVDSLPRAKRIAEVALSPDGTRVAYIAEQKLMVIPAAGGLAQQISVKDNLALRDVAWSVDSKQIAFVADLPGSAPSAQIWTASSDGSGMKQHGELKGYVQTPRFSPDGTKLALLFVEGMPRIAGPLEPMTPLSGVVDDQIFEQRIATLDFTTDKITQLTPADLYVYEYDWTPDGKAWVGTAAHGSGDGNWYIASLYRFDVANGEMREIYKPKLQVACPRVSPDGKNVAFIEGLMSDEGSTGGEIHVVPITGGPARDVTPNIKASPSALAWTGPKQITFAQIVDGDTGFGSVDVASATAKTLWTGEEFAYPAGEVWAAGRSADGQRAIVGIVRQSATAPPEVWAGTIGSWKQITNLNAGLKPAWGEMKKVHWPSGTLQIQGWLMLPKDFTPGKTYPLVVTAHGGPSAACLSVWDHRSMGALSAMGYFSLCPNPRGSYGQGEAFTQANVKDFGGGDFRDIMAGVDALLKQYPIDSKRLGIRGHSYGGYMTMWAETHTQRFAAAVAGAGLSDWLSYYGVNDLDQWMIPFFGASIYDNPGVYAKSDPMHFVKSVKTPTLILVGDRDGEVPMEQSVEWWHALTTLNVPTKLVVYPDEGHAIGKPADARDYIVRTLAWFDEWFAKAEKASGARDEKPTVSAKDMRP